MQARGTEDSQYNVKAAVQWLRQEGVRWGEMPELPLGITNTQYYKRMPSYQRLILIRKMMEAQSDRQYMVLSIHGFTLSPSRMARGMPTMY